MTGSCFCIPLAMLTHMLSDIILPFRQELNFKSKPNVWAYFSVKASICPSKFVIFFCVTHHHSCKILVFSIMSLGFNRFFFGQNMYLGMIQTNPNIISLSSVWRSNS